MHKEQTQVALNEPEKKLFFKYYVVKIILRGLIDWRDKLNLKKENLISISRCKLGNVST